MRSSLCVMKKRGSSGGWQHNLAGISPLPAKAASPNACGAFSARTMAIKVCLLSMRVIARKPLHLLPGAVLAARLFPIGEKCHGAPAVWLGTKRTYPMCPILLRRYLAGFPCGSLLRNTPVFGILLKILYRRTQRNRNGEINVCSIDFQKKRGYLRRGQRHLPRQPDSVRRSGIAPMTP